MTETTLSRAQRFTLAVLRMAIGWHFAYEGFYKLMLPGWSRAGERLHAWSAAGYLNAASGPFAWIAHRAAQPPYIAWIDLIVPIALLAIGVSLMLGVFTRLSAWAAIAFLTLVYLSSIPTSGMPAPGAEGAYLFVNKNLIEAAALFVLIAFSRRHTATAARVAATVSAAAVLVVSVGACGAKSDRANDGSLTIAVIPKGTSHVFWQSIHAGAVKAGRELGVEVAWRGPTREDDRDSQVSEVESAVARGVAGIVLAPLDESALVAPVESAARSRVPVVIIDSGLKTESYVSFVATDNEVGGRLGGDHLASILGGKGKVVLLRYAEGSDSTNRREAGFLGAMQANPGIEVVSSNQYGGADVEGAYKKGEALLSRFKQPDGTLGIDGIFCPNESTTFAMMRVLQDNGWAGRVKFVGFDASSNLVKGLRDGHIHGLVVQDPVRMGYLGVKTMVAHIRGEKVERRIDTGAKLVTREAMDTPAMKELIQPDLSQWLK